MKKCTHCGAYAEDDKDVCPVCKANEFEDFNTSSYEKTVIDEQKDWSAVIYDYGTTIALCFETKPSEIPIQGEVDSALEDIYGWETETGIDDLVMEMDDGSYLVYFGDCPEEQHVALKPQIIKYLTTIYTENKARFEECIKANLEEYDEL